MRIIPETKSNYLGLNGISLEVKETVGSLITCSILHPELNKVTNVDFNESEVKLRDNKREAGYYWVKSQYASDWQIAQYEPFGIYFYFNNGSRQEESSIYMIDENKIKREA